jgi:hypothetical protein
LAALFAALVLSGTGETMSTVEHPQTTITNGTIEATLYLPDAKRGYYVGTRFDWSGVIASLKYQKHDYYGPWFDKADPPVHDFVYRGGEIVAGACSTISGPVEEFNNNEAALGYEEARPGGTFIKIGIGVLRKPDAQPYDRYRLYEIVDPGKWEVHTERDTTEFIQTLDDASSGYGYVYRKTVRLIGSQPQMVLEHSLKNTGRRPIQTEVYNHNFLVLDKQAPGPDFVITFPFEIKAAQPAQGVEIKGKQILYPRALSGEDVATASIGGFGNHASDYNIRIENKKLKAGMVISADRPLFQASLWSIRSVLAVEPFISMNVEPGHEFKWNLTYHYFTE